MRFSCARIAYHQNRFSTIDMLESHQPRLFAGGLSNRIEQFKERLEKMRIQTPNQKPSHPRSSWKIDKKSYHPASQKRVPPGSTGAEGFYYIKQMDSKTSMVIRLLNGDEICGVIEWYDDNCLKIHPLNGSGIAIMKHSIKYIYKQKDQQ